MSMAALRGPWNHGVRYLAVSQYGDDGESQGFNVLLESRSHGYRQLLQNSESLLDLENKQTVILNFPLLWKAVY